MKHVGSVVFILALGLVSSLPCKAQSAESEIRKLLQTQMDAWNRGDIRTFMEGYLNSEELHFVGASSVTYGWGATLKRYLEAYPDRQTMGTLSFDLKEITKRTAEVYTVIGRYNLERDAMEDASGNFLLVVQKVNSDWRIVADSTH